MRSVRSPTERSWPLDVLLAMVVGVLMLVGSRPAALGQVPPREPLNLLSDVLIVLAAAPLAVRRVWPVGVLAVAVGVIVVYEWLHYPHGPILFAASIAMYTVAERRPARLTLIAGLLAFAAILAPEVLHLDGGQLGTDGLLLLVTRSGLLVLPSALGEAVRLRTQAARQAVEDEARRRVYEERLRIAREVHDGVGHSLAVINMQAGIALHVRALRPEQTYVALDAIKETSKQALEELRTTLAVFRRTEDVDGLRTPAPGLDQLEPLLDALDTNGLPVHLTVGGDRRSLPAAVDLAAYRIVQESLTNALRHADPASAQVHINYQPGAVELTITNDGRARPSAPPQPGGLGITGMRERATSVGGTLEAGPRTAGGFEVRARLPIAESAP